MSDARIEESDINRMLNGVDVWIKIRGEMQCEIDRLRVDLAKARAASDGDWHAVEVILEEGVEAERQRIADAIKGLQDLATTMRDTESDIVIQGEWTGYLDACVKILAAIEKPQP